MDYTIVGKVGDLVFQQIKLGLFQDALSLNESLRSKQIRNKKWIINELANLGSKWEKVLVLGSWNSIVLHEMLSNNFDVSWFDFVDIDPQAHSVRDMFFEINKMEKNYESITMDATEFSDHAGYDLVINTSCEHMLDIPAVYGPLYVLQSTDDPHPKEHINCSTSVEDLKEKNNITNILYKGAIWNNKPYKRFMCIGYYI